MPDTISDALRAAALAGLNPGERMHVDEHHDGEPGPGHIAEAARVVAAYLRARQQWAEDDGAMHTAGWYALEADAVEEATDAR